MKHSIPNITAGNTLTLTNVEFVDYPSSTWTLTLTLILIKSMAPSRIFNKLSKDFTAAVSGGVDQYDLSLSTDDTISLNAGKFQYEISATDGVQAVTLEAGFTTVTLSLKNQDSQDDTREHAQIMVDQIEALLAGRAKKDVDSYTIGSRSLSKIGIEQLILLRDYYVARVALLKGVKNKIRYRL